MRHIQTVSDVTHSPGASQTRTDRRDSSASSLGPGLPASLVSGFFPYLSVHSYLTLKNSGPIALPQTFRFLMLSIQETMILRAHQDSVLVCSFSRTSPFSPSAWTRTRFKEIADRTYALDKFRNDNDVFKLTIHLFNPPFRLLEYSNFYDLLLRLLDG